MIRITINKFRVYRSCYRSYNVCDVYSVIKGFTGEDDSCYNFS